MLEKDAIQDISTIKEAMTIINISKEKEIAIKFRRKICARSQDMKSMNSRNANII